MDAGVDRRWLLAGLGAGGVAWGVGRARTPPPVSPAPLRRHAERKGMGFGMAVALPELAEPARAALVAREADMLVGGNELKWTWIEREPGRPDYSRADALAAFASAHGLQLRGHVAFWYGGVPPWARPALLTPRGPRIALDRIAAVVGRMRGRVAEWDVVNEVVEPKDGAPGGLRRAPFAVAPDAAFYADCFHVAREADPQARLYLNEHYVEGDTPYEASVRAGLLKLLAALKARGAPVQGVGIQAHLASYRRFSSRKFRDFLAEIAAMGLAIRLTEFDIADTRTAGDIAARDAATVDYARRFLDTAFDERATRGLLTWGTVDGGSWLQGQAWARRADGAPLRPLPFDDAGGRTPLWDAIARAYDGAPAR